MNETTREPTFQWNEETEKSAKEVGKVFEAEGKFDQSGDIAPINNKADGKDDRFMISPDWEERFDALTIQGGDYVEMPRDVIKSFIQSELDAAFSEGASKTALLFDQVITPDKIRAEERQRVIEKLKEMKRKVIKSSKDAGWNQALDQAIKELQNL